MPLFQPKAFTSAAGLSLAWKIECDALTPEDWAGLAYVVSLKLKFDRVIGVPTGGLRFAKALQEYSSRGQQTLIVDDVLTTGKSMELVRIGVTGPVTGVVAFSRGKCPQWVYPIFQLNDLFEGSTNT